MFHVERYIFCVEIKFNPLIIVNLYLWISFIDILIVLVVSPIFTFDISKTGQGEVLVSASLGISFGYTFKDEISKRVFILGIDIASLGPFGSKIPSISAIFGADAEFERSKL